MAKSKCKHKLRGEQERVDWDKSVVSKPLKVFTKRGKYLTYSSPLTQFMGRNNAIFLTAIINFYEYLSRKNKVENGIIWYEATQIDKKWGISPKLQNKAIEELTHIGLLKKIGRGHRYTKVLKIYMKRCTCIFELVYDLQEDVNLRAFYKELMKGGKTWKMTIKWLKGMEVVWDGRYFPQNGALGYRNSIKFLRKRLSKRCPKAKTKKVLGRR